MFPRLKTSKKWTAFPNEYVRQIEQAFLENFSAELQNAKLIVQGRIYPSEIMLRVGFLEKGRLTQNNFEVSLDLGKDKNAIMDKIHLAIDAIGSLMHEFFESDGTMELPRIWKEFEFNKTKLYLQFNGENTDLEQEANKLLGLEQVDLLNETKDDDDEFTPETDSEVVDEEDDDPELGTAPQIFKKKKKTDIH